MKNPVIILLVIILLAVLGVGAYMFIINKKEDCPCSSESEQPTLMPLEA